MKRFVLLTIAVFTATLALVSGARAVGRANGGENPLKGIGFDLCDGQPCFMGIIPGITTWEEARIMMSNHGGSLQESQSAETSSEIGVVTSFGRVFLKPNTTHTLVNEMSFEDLRLNSTLPEVAEFFALYGLPCGEVISFNNIVAIYFPGIVIFIGHIGKRVQLDTRPYAFSLVDITTNGPSCANGLIAWGAFQLSSRQAAACHRESKESSKTAPRMMSIR